MTPANAIDITGESGSLFLTNTNHMDSPDIWLRYTAPANWTQAVNPENIFFSTRDQRTTFQTTLYAFTSNLVPPALPQTVADLTPLGPYLGGGNEPNGFGYSNGAEIAFPVSNAQVIYLRISNRFGTAGNCILSWGQFFPETLGSCDSCSPSATGLCKVAGCYINGKGFFGFGSVPAGTYYIMCCQGSFTGYYAHSGAYEPLTTGDVNHIWNIQNNENGILELPVGANQFYTSANNVSLFITATSVPTTWPGVDQYGLDHGSTKFWNPNVVGDVNGRIQDAQGNDYGAWPAVVNSFDWSVNYAAGQVATWSGSFGATFYALALGNPATDFSTNYWKHPQSGTLTHLGGPCGAIQICHAGGQIGFVSPYDANVAALSLMSVEIQHQVQVTISAQGSANVQNLGGGDYLYGTNISLVNKNSIFATGNFTVELLAINGVQNPYYAPGGTSNHVTGPITFSLNGGQAVDPLAWYFTSSNTDSLSITLKVCDCNGSQVALYTFVVGTSLLHGYMDVIPQKPCPNYNASEMALIPALTANNSSSFVTVSASGFIGSGWEVWRAFDNNVFTEWGSTGIQDWWLAMQFASPQTVTRWDASFVNSYGFVNNYQLQGCNDGVNWQNVGSLQIGGSHPSTGGATLSTPATFTYWRLYFYDSQPFVVALQLYSQSNPPTWFQVDVQNLGIVPASNVVVTVTNPAAQKTLAWSPDNAGVDYPNAPLNPCATNDPTHGTWTFSLGEFLGLWGSSFQGKSITCQRLLGAPTSQQFVLQITSGGAPVPPLNNTFTVL